MLNSSSRSPVADQDSVVSCFKFLSGVMHTKLSSWKSRHGYITTDFIAPSNEYTIDRHTGFCLLRISGSWPSVSLSSDASIAKRKADRPDGRAVVKAAFPTICGRITDLMPSAAKARLV